MRRRNLLNNNNGKLVLNSDFLFWFDGKRYLDSSSWYPLILSGDTLVKKSDYYLLAITSPTYDSIRGCINVPNGSTARYSSRDTWTNIVNQMVPGGLGDFTFMTAVDCEFNASNPNRIYIMASSFGIHSSKGRGQICINWDGDMKFRISINFTGDNWIHYIGTKNVPNSTHIRTLACKRSGSNVNFYLNGQLFETITTSSDKILTSNDEYQIPTYDQTSPLQTQLFYGQVAYKSALSDGDINSMHNYFVKYYNM